MFTHHEGALVANTFTHLEGALVANTFTHLEAVRLSEEGGNKLWEPN